MKVAPKLVLAAWMAFLPALGLHAWLSVRREQALFRSEMESGLSLLGEHLRQVVVTEWARNGASEVEALLAASGPAGQDVEIHWLPPDPTPTPRGLASSTRDELVWLEPVAFDDRAAGRIEISESLAPMHRYVRATVMRLGLLSVVLGLASVVLARALGQRLIGRRLGALVEFTRRTGAGHLGARMDVGGNDEISTLAKSLGEMSGQLASALEQTKAANAERLSMLQQLRHADRLTSIGRLAGSVAHELGTPLNVAMGHATRIVKGTMAPEEVRHSAEVIHRQMDRMTSTIHNVLGFVRSSTPSSEAVDLVRVVESVHDLLAPFLDERHVTLVVSPAPESAFVQGSEIQLEQAVSNLIANAIDATDGAGRVEVAIERTQASRGVGSATRPVVALRVRDHGLGVPEDAVQRLFEPFFTSKPEGSGTGLGLWITQGIVHDHGGWLEFANLPDGGACFTLRIPEARAC